MVQKSFLSWLKTSTGYIQKNVQVLESAKRLIVVQKTVGELINISSHADFKGFISSE